MNVQQAYTDWAATYDSDRNLTRDLDQSVTRTVLGELRCKSILELGCGTGKNTTLLAQIGEQVQALDFSAGMLERAREKITSANVSFTVADVTQPWPFGDQFFDLIAGNLVLEHIEDLSFIFAEASRTLMDGGQFFVCELHPFRQYLGVQAQFKRDQKTIGVAAFVHHISDFLNAGARNGLLLQSLKEWWHAEDRNKPPRLISFSFIKS